MSRLVTAARVAGAVGAALGAAALGAAAGLAAERATVGRSAGAGDPYRDEDFGAPLGRSLVVEADDGVQLHVEVVDEAEPAALPLTVVMCHGYALNLDTWHFQRQDLAHAARLVLWDQRSHGRSGRSLAENVSIAQLGRDLERVVEATAPEGHVVLVGHSMGGMTVLSLARQRPELFGGRVPAVALVCTSAGDMGAPTLGVPGPLGRIVHRLGPGVVAAMARQPELVERSRRAGSDLGYLATKHYSFGSDVPPSVVELVAGMNASTPIDVIAHFLPVFEVHDEYDALPALERTELLVVGAEQDRLTPVEHSREIVRRLPHADYVELSDAGHMAMLEHPDVVSEHLLDLLERSRRAVALEAG